MQNKNSILRQEGCWVASSLQGNANLITNVLLDIPKCTSVSRWQHTTGSHLLYPVPPIRTHPVILLITSLNYKVYAGGPGFIFDELHEIREDTLVIFAFSSTRLLLWFFLTAARMSMVLFIRSLLPVMSSSKQNSRWCSWHPGNSVESCNGAAALQQLQLWSHKSELNRERAEWS